MTTDKLICAVESGKYEGATFVVGEEYIMESTFLAKLFIRVWFNPILTGLFQTKFLLGGGGGGGSIWPPLQISAPKGPIAAKFCMDVKTHLKSIATEKKLPKMVYLLYYYNLCKLDARFHKFINISNK